MSFSGQACSLVTLIGLISSISPAFSASRTLVKGGVAHSWCSKNCGVAGSQFEALPVCCHDLKGSGPDGASCCESLSSKLLRVLYVMAVLAVLAWTVPTKRVWWSRIGNLLHDAGFTVFGRPR